MAIAFRHVKDMRTDLETEVKTWGLFEDANVRIAKTTDYKNAKKLFQNQGKEAVCVIAIGDFRYPETGSRNSRRSTIALFCIGKYNKGNVDADLAELADDVIKKMLPADTKLNTQRVISGVVYEPAFQGSLLEMGHDVYLIELDAYDQRLDETVRLTRNN